MKTSIIILFLASLAYTGHCQFAELMSNPALMMSAMRGGGGMGGMGAMGGIAGMPMIDFNSAPVIDPQMFANMAKIAALMGPATTGPAQQPEATGKGGKRAAKPVVDTSAANDASSGIDPFLMMTMMQQSGMQLDPLTIMLLSQQSQPSSKQTASTQSSTGGAMDPMMMAFLMQQSGGGSLFG